MIFMFLRFFMDVIQCVEVGNGFLLKMCARKIVSYLCIQNAESVK